MTYDDASLEQFKTRGLILTSWAAASSEELLRILESGTYAYPMKKDDSLFIVNHLWRVHRDELAENAQERLHSMIGTSVLSEGASQNLEAYLLALAGDELKLIDLWDSQKTVPVTVEQAFVQLECLTHTNTCNQGVIDFLIGMVEQDAPFSLRYDAMMMLGRLDAARGSRAAEVIRASIHDCAPDVAAARSHVMARLEGTNHWMRCKECCHGLIHETKSFGESSCAHCFGLGFLLT